LLGATPAEVVRFSSSRICWRMVFATRVAVGRPGRHGNFHPAAYQRICSNREWNRRLEKVHTASKRSRVRADWQWKELDSTNSSDALLMNIFCHPEVMTSTNVRAMLGVESNAVPEFGFKPRTPLQTGRRDNTEIDMKVDNLLVEAKLTESDFQLARLDLICRYRDLEAVFDLSELPMRNEKQGGYQLIRGALAAYAAECSFCVFCDARRPDLVEAWYRVMRAVRLFELRCRLKLLTWQELASVLPEDLRCFLAAKYGIFPVAHA
jgi:Restriction Endonuclease associating with ARP